MVWMCPGKHIQAMAERLIFPNQTDDGSPARILDAKDCHGF